MSTDPHRDLFVAEVSLRSKKQLDATSLQDAPFVDGLLEALEEPAGSRMPRRSGRIAAFQFKSRLRFLIKLAHLEYYQRCSIPVLLVWRRKGKAEEGTGIGSLEDEYLYQWAHEVLLPARRESDSLSKEVSIPETRFLPWNSTRVRDEILKYCRSYFPTSLASAGPGSLLQVRLQFAEAIAGLVALSTGPDALDSDPGDLAEWKQLMNSQCAPTRERVLGGRYMTSDDGRRRGSFAFISRAVDTWTGADVAIKTFNPDYLAHPGALLTLKAATEIADRLSSHDVVPFLEPIRLDMHGLWTVLPWLDGGSLQDRAESGRWPDSFQAAELLLGLATVLAAAHSIAAPTTGSSGILHRDLHPGNVLFDSEASWRPYVSDWDMGYDAESKVHASASLGAGMLLYRHPRFLSRELAHSPMLDLFALCRMGRALLLPANVAANPNTSSEQLQVAEAGHDARLGEHGKQVRNTLRSIEEDSTRSKGSIAGLVSALQELLQAPWEISEKARRAARVEAEREWELKQRLEESYHDRRAEELGYGDASNMKYWGANE